MRIVHITSVHPRGDTRIFHKMAKSMAGLGHQVSLVVADGKGDEQLAGVQIIDVGVAKNRWDRIRKKPMQVAEKAESLNADTYHLHDPELLTVALRLKKRGRRVVFDAHEDVPTQILSKPYIHPRLRKLISSAFAAFEGYVCKQLDGVIAATPYIRDKFLKINPNSVDINNFPMLEELYSEQLVKRGSRTVCYIGGISRVRGAQEIVQAMALTTSPARLALCGNFIEGNLESALKSETAGWAKVDYRGYVDRAGVRNALESSIAGLVTLHPITNYLDSLPVKMFEYMAAGVAVIASDFPYWREIVVKNDCGLCVDPMDPKAIAEAIDFLVQNPAEARRLGENGRKAAVEKFNWAAEERKLAAFYNSLLVA